ncbi:MAG: hypothetical protein J3R72DRAFT_432524 [Linnemannia gamsii]|nr:MAG: hypothetical protein J3R72DRAFT_432524 [Linnemannia gamsii]
MISASSPMARLVSVANATRLLRTLPKRTFFTSPSSAASPTAKFNGFFNSSSSYNRFASSTSTSTPLSRFAAQKFQQPRSFSSSRFATTSPSTATAATKSKSPLNPTQSVRNYSHHSWHGEHHEGRRAGWFGGRFGRHHHREATAAAAAAVKAAGLNGPKLEAEVHKHIRDTWHYGCRRGYHHHPFHHNRRYRPRRFLFRMMVLSTVLVAVPMVMIFDAPCSTLAYVPLTVGGAGLALMLTGRLLYIALPILAIGGAGMFWATTMPAANTIKDLKKILERDEKASGYGRYTPTALSALGGDWEIQPARPDEWFRWTFPTTASTSATKSTDKPDASSLDKLSVRMAILDPHDQSDRKLKTMKFLDKLQDNKDMSHKMKRHFKEHADSHSNNTHHKECGQMLESLQVHRDGDHILIQMEDDGAKMMDQPWAKKYLTLGQIVDRAASEMEAARPGMKLGEQVVLVHKNSQGRRGDKEDSFWRRWSPYGDLSLRIPFDRTWVKDLSDE